LSIFLLFWLKCFFWRNKTRPKNGKGEKNERGNTNRRSQVMGLLIRKEGGGKMTEKVSI
jgi:hypothetical protein